MDFDCDFDTDGDERDFGMHDDGDHDGSELAENELFEGADEFFGVEDGGDIWGD